MHHLGVLSILSAVKTYERLIFTMRTWADLKSAFLESVLRQERAAFAETRLLSAKASHVFELGVFVLDEKNPFVQASKLMLRHGEAGISLATKHLTSFFTVQRGKNVTQYLEIRGGSVGKCFDIPSEQWTNPLEASLSPWDDQDIRDVRIPDQLSPSRSANDVERLWNLIVSIKTRGYQRDSGPDGDITCEALVSLEGSIRFHLIGGTHRAAVLVAMGYERIPVRVLRFVCVDLAKEWPKVQSGVFSLGGALERFEKFFK